MPRISAEDFTIVLKPRVTVDLKATFQFSGEVCHGAITVHEQETSAFLKSRIHWRGANIAVMRKLGKTPVALLTFQGHKVPRFAHYNSVITPVREYKCTMPTCYRCGTVGHRADLCTYPNHQRCGHCVQVVGATEEGMTPHDYKPSCLVCGEGHLTGSQACKARCRWLQQPGGHHGDRGSPQQRPAPKTLRRQSGATQQAPKNPVAGRSLLASKQTPPLPTTSQTPHRTSTKTPDQGAPKLQAGEFLPLFAASGIRPPAKNTSTQVGNGARAASTPHCPSPTSSPEFFELKHDLAVLRAQNTELLAEIAALEAGSTPVTSTSPLPSTEITLGAL
ncbi:hypothetical protein HPB50_007376 [Hyalomma asiaticum]|uniref:Uncharacterized protein n=1 Tax=Hyalomma asiaticum TaxID=266040 RepID=A0ACB7SWK3_HYAAI|nr:hypothetical protein HPB50_007376 [Hyalomma asiaticum]